VVYIDNSVPLTFDYPVYAVVTIVFQTSVSAISSSLLTVGYIPVSGFISL
jgi:hypothetical protein